MSDLPAARNATSFSLAALAWGFAEATLFFVVPDVVLGWIAVRRGARAAMIACLFAAVGAMFGAAIIYQWSAARPAQAAAVIEALPAIPAGAVARARADMREGSWLTVAALGSVANRPFKLFAAAAPWAGVSLPAFAAATPLIRLPRFVLNALALGLVAALLRRRGWSERPIAVLYGVGWTLFYIAFWLLSPW
jgi:membrane protein YqaA with SNARE-associated domain